MIGRKALFCLAGILSLAVCSFAQERRLMYGQGGLGGYEFFFDTIVSPGEPPVKTLGGGIRVDGQIHRVMIDKDSRSYFGYDVSVEVLSTPDTYRITFGPLTGGPRSFLQDGENPSAYTQLATPDWGGPAARTIRAGEVIALTLLANSRTGQKIVDYVTVMKTGDSPERLGPLPLKSVSEEGSPRDFRAEDAWLDVQPTGATLDGRPVQLPGGASGIFPYFSIPGHGRVILSLTPDPTLGFRKAGEIRGTSMSITFSGHRLNVNNQGRIAPGAGPFNLYVLHQPNWPTTGTGVASAQHLRSSQGFRVKGRVEGAIPAGQAQGAVVLERIGADADRRTPLNVAPDGSFEAIGLPAGSYEVLLLNRTVSAFVLSEKDITDLVIRLPVIRLR